MSVVSSRVSSVSSILKTPGIRSQFTRRSRVSFKIPENLKDIIFNFESGNGRKEYEELIYLLKECNIEDNDLLEFLVNVRQCISLLGANHKLLVEAILQIRWTNRSKETAVAYKAFLEDLICMQIYHIKCIIDSLVDQFKPGLDDKVKWIDSKSKEQDLLKLNHIHDVLRKILKVVPMSKQLLLNSIRAKFPYMTLGVHMYEVYTSSLLEILKYAPELRSEILCLIISRLMILDVHIPRPKHENEEQENQEEEEEEEMEDDRGCDERVTTNNNDINKISSNVELITDTLDTCMEQLFTHLHECCFKNETLDMESLRSLYFDILKLFETVILPTHAIQFVQYIIFYICSFKTALVEAFIDWLWRKTTDLNVPSVMRQSAVCYVGSLLASASYVQPRLIKTVLSNMSQWIHNYILTNTDNERGEHWVFYTVCQALFLLIISRYKDFINSKEDILFLYELNLDKIVTCKLNPLKMCEPHIVFRFADITKTYQLAYCYTIIENNSRNTLPVAESQYSTRLETFFPFGTYKLELSGKKVTPLIYYCAINFKRKESSKDLYENIEFMTE